MKRFSSRLSGLFLPARILVGVTAFGVLAGSYFFYNPMNDPLGTNFDPRVGQTLVYGGIVILIAVFTWRWPVPGGTVATLYGFYKIFEHIRMSSPLFNAPLTLMPAPIYYLLYALFIIGGVLCIVSRPRNLANLETRTHPKVQKIARIITIVPVVLSILVALGALVGAMARVDFDYPGFLVTSMIFLSPVLLTVVIISWKWPAPGGMLTSLIGLAGVWLLLSSGMGLWYKFSYSVFCIGFMLGGILNIVLAIRTKNEQHIKAPD